VSSTLCSTCQHKKPHSAMPRKLNCQTSISDFGVHKSSLRFVSSIKALMKSREGKKKERNVFNARIRGEQHQQQHSRLLYQSSVSRDVDDVGEAQTLRLLFSHVHRITLCSISLAMAIGVGYHERPRVCLFSILARSFELCKSRGRENLCPVT
jgi:hypothetical protein